MEMTKMPSKKVRARTIAGEIENRKFAKSLEVFDSEQLASFEYLSMCNAAEMNEAECKELIELEAIRAAQARENESV